MTDVSNATAEVGKGELTQIDQLMLCVENDLSEPCLDTLWEEVKELMHSRECWISSGNRAMQEKLAVIAERDAQAARIAELEAAQGVVKLLEWTGGETSVSASTPFGDYIVEFDNEYGWGFWFTDEDIDCKDPIGGYYPTPEDAKAAAQSDYKRRIRSVFTTPPADTVAEAVKAERQACAATVMELHSYYEGKEEPIKTAARSALLAVTHDIRARGEAQP